MLIRSFFAASLRKRQCKRREADAGTFCEIPPPNPGLALTSPPLCPALADRKNPSRMTVSDFVSVFPKSLSGKGRWADGKARRQSVSAAIHEGAGTQPNAVFPPPAAQAFDRQFSDRL